MLQIRDINGFYSVKGAKGVGRSWNGQAVFRMNSSNIGLLGSFWVSLAFSRSGRNGLENLETTLGESLYSTLLPFGKRDSQKIDKFLALRG